MNVVSIGKYKIFTIRILIMGMYTGTWCTGSKNIDILIFQWFKAVSSMKP